MIRDAIGELPPELTGGLTFHLPMEVQALEHAGADRSVIDRRVEEGIAEAFAAGLVDPPLYRWAVDHYRPTATELLSDDRTTREAAFGSIVALGEGLAGAAFHGLIRLGYAAWRRDDVEMARGLAYLRTRRQVLNAGVVGDDLRAELPPADQRDGLTVFDLLNVVAGAGVASPTVVGRTLRSAATDAAGLVRRNPSSFVAVHALTGLHAMCEVHRLACGDESFDQWATSITAPWWSAYLIAGAACAALTETQPHEDVVAYDGTHGPVDSVDALVSASILTGDTHDVKTAVSLRRLVEFGLLDEADAVATGLRRLAAGMLI